VRARSSRHVCSGAPRLEIGLRWRLDPWIAMANACWNTSSWRFWGKTSEMRFRDRQQRRGRYRSRDNRRSAIARRLGSTRVPSRSRAGRPFGWGTEAGVDGGGRNRRGRNCGLRSRRPAAKEEFGRVSEAGAGCESRHSPGAAFPSVGLAMQISRCGWVTAPAVMFLAAREHLAGTDTAATGRGWYPEVGWR